MKRYSLRFSATLLLPCLFFLCLLLLSGCASIKVIEAWNKSQTPGHRYQKLMIVGIGHDESIRAMVENILVDELRKNGVTAMASHTLVKEIDSAKREDIVAAVRTSGADAVLTIRPIAKGNTSVTQDGQSWGVYGTATNYGGTILPGARTYEDAVLQTNLFDSATAELVWSATISTYDAERPARVSRDLAGVILKDLRQDGFL
jgi:uncharacterized protein YceK